MILLVEPMVAKSDAEIQQLVQPYIKDKIIWVDLFLGSGMCLRIGRV